MASLWQREPALVTATVVGLIDAALVLAVSFGAPISPDQKTAIDAFVSAALALAGLLVAGVITRVNVTPSRNSRAQTTASTSTSGVPAQGVRNHV